MSVRVLRFKDPSMLTNGDLLRALHGLSDDREWLGPDHMARLLQAGRDRFELTFKDLADMSGYPLSTVFSLTRYRP